jgi:glycosyltransferase involved in cell wall biosynthesis
MRGRVHVVGRVEQTALEAWYRNASVFAFPSRVEGFGYPPLEAMARGVPVVSSTGGSLPEVLGDAALLVGPDDVVGWSHAVDRIVGAAEVRAQAVAMGYTLVRRYDWPTAARRVAELTAGLLGSP